MGIEAIGSGLKRNRLRWFGHVEMKKEDDKSLYFKHLKWVSNVINTNLNKNFSLSLKGVLQPCHPTLHNVTFFLRAENLFMHI